MSDEEGDGPAMDPEVASKALALFGAPKLTPEQAAALEKAQALAARVGGTANLKTAAELAASDPLAAAQQYAQQLALQAQIEKSMVDQSGGEQTHFQDEIEINDYPQHARWVVTQKDALGQVTEWTGVAITTRGVYCAPGRNPPMGEKKLHLLIEGRTLFHVQRAKAEIKRMLEEAAANSVQEKPQYGKYSVV